MQQEDVLARLEGLWQRLGLNATEPWMPASFDVASWTRELNFEDQARMVQYLDHMIAMLDCVPWEDLTPLEQTVYEIVADNDGERGPNTSAIVERLENRGIKTTEASVGNVLARMRNEYGILGGTGKKTGYLIERIPPGTPEHIRECAVEALRARSSPGSSG